MDHIAAVIVAAGNGERLPGETPKQLRLLSGHAMVVWSARRMVSAGIDTVVVVVAAGREAETTGVLADEIVVAGGETRQESVWRGLMALPDDVTHVLVHDGARPCVSQALIKRVIVGLEKSDAVVPSVPAVDTLVEESAGTVRAIVDRQRVAGVQTPQGFAIDVLRRAHENAQTHDLTSSDDGSLVLALGEPVSTVSGERLNMKVTFPDDLLLAEAILRRAHE